MKMNNIKRVKILLFMEYLIVVLNIIIVLALVYILETLKITNNLENIFIIFSIIILLFTAFISIFIEQKVGYYECSICLNRYKPKYFNVFFAFHINRTRYMKCPKCLKKSWQKKVLTKN